MREYWKAFPSLTARQKSSDQLQFTGSRNISIRFGLFQVHCCGLLIYATYTYKYIFKIYFPYLLGQTPA